MNEEEEWKVLSGCNACINSKVCKSQGNCIMLTVDKILPEYTKSKRKLIQRIRTYGNGSIEQIQLIVKKVEREREKATGDQLSKKIRIDKSQGWLDEPNEKMIRTWKGPVRLTVIEKMFIDELNKPR